MAEITVPFAGDGAGVAALTWGQRHIWDWIQASGVPLSMTAVRDLADGATVDEFVDELRFFMSRFQAMRARLGFSADGTPYQIISAEGEIGLPVIDVADGGDPAAVVADLAARHQEDHFDYPDEFPVRMILIRHRGRLTHLVTTLCHLYFDVAAAMVMFNDLLARDPATGQPPKPVGQTLLDLAAWQASPAGQRQNAVALRYWEEQLRAVPVRQVAGERDGYWEYNYASRALHLALTSIVDQTGADSAPVLLALFATAFARVTGRDPVPLEIIVSNRFRPGFADVVGPVNQSGFALVEPGGLTFPELVAQVRRRTLSAYKHAYFDPASLAGLLARLAAERGVEPEVGFLVNDRRSPAAFPPAGVRPSVAEIRAARPETAVERKPMRHFHKKFMIYFNDVPDTTSIMIHTDGRYVSAPTVDALLVELESVAEAVAADPTAVVGPPAPATTAV